jgi:peptidoglycan hydrolase-like protein with peptidoglycan-binding domain
VLRYVERLSVGLLLAVMSGAWFSADAQGQRNDRYDGRWYGALTCTNILGETEPLGAAGVMIGNGRVRFGVGFFDDDKMSAELSLEQTESLKAGEIAVFGEKHGQRFAYRLSGLLDENDDKAILSGSLGYSDGSPENPSSKPPLSCTAELTRLRDAASFRQWLNSGLPQALEGSPAAQSQEGLRLQQEVVLLKEIIQRPKVEANRDAVAVVIGNRTYRSERVPAVEYAHRDADAVKTYLLQGMGYDPANIIDMRDASQAQMEAAFGNARTHEGRLWRFIRAGRSDVTVFYSGHGVPGLKDKRGYLLPVDADPESAEINGYPLDTLYENLGKLNARSVTVWLDACFSGESAKGMLVRGASGLMVTARLPQSLSEITVLTAASGDQVASWDDDARYGLFTRHLLDALQGKADIAPFGNGDGKITSAEAKAYMDEEMTYAARRRFGRTQEVSLQGPADRVIGHVAAFDLREVPTAAAPSNRTMANIASPGSIAMDVAEVQHVLNNLGYPAGPEDGKLGPSTRAAIEQFQRDFGMTPTGTITDELRKLFHGLPKRPPHLDGLVAQAYGKAIAPAVSNKTPLHDFGLTVTPLTPTLRDHFRLEAKNGVVVTDVDSSGPGAEKGVRPGEAILEINEQPVVSVKDLFDKVAKAKSAGQRYVLLTMEGQSDPRRRLLVVPLKS